MRFRPSQHLRKASEFRRVRDQGTRVDCGPFVAYYLRVPGPGGTCAEAPRLGLVVSRRVGNAVVRNRVKRRFREVFRRCQELLPGDCHVVLIARRACVFREQTEIERRFRKLCRNISASGHAKPI